MRHKASNNAHTVCSVFFHINFSLEKCSCCFFLFPLSFFHSFSHSLNVLGLGMRDSTSDLLFSSLRVLLLLPFDSFVVAQCVRLQRKYLNMLWERVRVCVRLWLLLQLRWLCILLIGFRFKSPGWCNAFAYYFRSSSARLLLLLFIFKLSFLTNVDHPLRIRHTVHALQITSTEMKKITPSSEVEIFKPTNTSIVSSSMECQIFAMLQLNPEMKPSDELNQIEDLDVSLWFEEICAVVDWMPENKTPLLFHHAYKRHSKKVFHS